MNEVQTEKLIQTSWNLLSELLETGKMTLGSGKVIEPKPGTLIKVVQDLAKMKPPKQRVIASVDGLRIAKTTVKPTKPTKG